MNTPNTSKQKPRLHGNTKRLMSRRTMWRRRALNAAIQLATWQTGMPGRDEVEAKTIKSLNKVREWFREPRATTVVMAIQRRAISAYRQPRTGT